MLKGPAVIVSPLIALQLDQVESIEESGVGNAALVNSTMREPQVIVQGFDRPNIWLGVEVFRDEQTKKKTLLDRVRETEKPGIVYASTRKHAEQIAEALQGQQVKAAYYHAGMRPNEREQVQEQCELSEKTHLSRSKLAEVLSRLEEVGMVEILASGEIVAVSGNVVLDDVVVQVIKAHESYRQYDKSRIEMMEGYAEVQDCRREYLLNYFGEEIDDPCGFCDTCDAGITVTEDEENMPFPINTKVKHATWGDGLVLRYEGDKMVVLFESVGYKTLATKIVTEHKLLTPV